MDLGSGWLLTLLDTRRLPVHLDIDIESAPWNLAGLVENPRFSGVGVALMQAAIQVSADEGFAGRIALHSLPQSQPFYRRYMNDLGIDSTHAEQLCYFEMTEEQATDFVERRPS